MKNVKKGWRSIKNVNILMYIYYEFLANDKNRYAALFAEKSDNNVSIIFAKSYKGHIYEILVKDFTKVTYQHFISCLFKEF